MALGQRLKQARLEKGFSQRQLCGDTITRNMLSQIENGSAKPSMDTLSYLAARLEKSVSYFLEETVSLSPNREQMLRARKAYTEGNYKEVCQLLAGCDGEDLSQERWLLECIALMEQAAQALKDGKDIFAGNLLERADAAGKKTPYDTSALQRQRLLMRYQADPEAAGELVKALPEDYREFYLRAQALLQTEDYDRAAGLLDGMENDDIQWHRLRAQAALGQKDYEKAILCFQVAEQQQPLESAKGLEQCYLALEDYKMAYHYACKQRNL